MGDTMGWWKPNGESTREIGDEVLDEAYDFIVGVSRTYQRDLGRKPTVAEFGMLLATALKSGASVEHFSEFEEIRIADVLVKTAKCPKRQKYSVGDIFIVPLPNKKFGSGRIYNLGGTWNLVEIFRFVSDRPRLPSPAERRERLFPPVLVEPAEVFEDWRWKIVESNPDYAPDDIQALCYVIGTQGNYQLVKVNEFKPFAKTSDEEAVKLPMMEFRVAEDIENSIAEQLERARIS